MHAENIDPDSSLPEKHLEIQPNGAIFDYVRTAAQRVFEPHDVEDMVRRVSEISQTVWTFHRPEIKAWLSMPHEPEQTQYAFSYGMKKLTLRYVPSAPYALKVSLYNVQRECERKIRETTLLYLAAYARMQLLADEHQRPLRYCFGTGNDRLQQWAKTTGQKIFGWECLPFGKNDCGLAAGATFYPLVKN